jgi:hypothetical protein
MPFFPIPIPVAPPAPDTAPRGLTRRALLASSAGALALLVSGCTSSGQQRDRVTDRQAAAMAAQVRVQAALVAAYQAAGKADPALASATRELAAQAGQQLDRLRAAAPGAAPAGRSSAATSSAAGPAAGQDATAWLVAQVTTTADSHAAACVQQVGARAALLGSIAAGLRGQAGQLS